MGLVKADSSEWVALIIVGVAVVFLLVKFFIKRSQKCCASGCATDSSDSEKSPKKLHQIK